MRRLIVLPAAIGLLLPATASAEIVKALPGESSSLTVAADQLKTFKKHKLTFTASGSAKKAGANTLTLPYRLSRWDFSTRDAPGRRRRDQPARAGRLV